MMFENERQLTRVGNVRVRYGHKKTEAARPAFELTMWDPTTGKSPTNIVIPVESADHFAAELVAAAAVMRAAIDGTKAA